MVAMRLASGSGLVLAIVSAATFGTSGSFADALLRTGWSPGAAVTTRIAVAALILTIPALRQLHGQWRRLWAHSKTIVAYGVLAVAGCQLCYFNAVQHLSVGVALLLEYLGTVLVVVWLWVRLGRRPRRLTVAGGIVAIAGLALVLDLAGAHHLDPVGVLWGLGAAVGLAGYFLLSSAADDPLPPLVMAWAGMTVGALGLGVLGACGALPMQASTRDVVLRGHQVSWLVPVAGLSVVAAVIAYVTGIGAARLLGPKLASFFGLTEVVCAVLFAWLLLGQTPTPLQIAGGVLILGGVALVRIDELREPDSLEPVEAALI